MEYLTDSESDGEILEEIKLSELRNLPNSETKISKLNEMVHNRSNFSNEAALELLKISPNIENLRILCTVLNDYQTIDFGFNIFAFNKSVNMQLNAISQILNCSICTRCRIELQLTEINLLLPTRLAEAEIKLNQIIYSLNSLEAVWSDALKQRSHVLEVKVLFQKGQMVDLLKLLEQSEKKLLSLENQQEINEIRGLLAINAYDLELANQLIKKPELHLVLCLCLNQFTEIDDEIVSFWVKREYEKVRVFLNTVGGKISEIAWDSFRKQWLKEFMEFYIRIEFSQIHKEVPVFENNDDLFDIVGGLISEGWMYRINTVDKVLELVK